MTRSKATEYLGDPFCQQVIQPVQLLYYVLHHIT